MTGGGSMQKTDFRRLWAGLAAMACVLALTLAPGTARAGEADPAADYDRAVAALSAPELERMRDACDAHDASLEGTGFTDPFSGTPEEPCADDPALPDPAGNGVIGVLEIPAIGVTLPVYYAGMSGDMTLGVEHVAGTGLPGGTPSNCVLAGRRGLPGAAMLRDIDRLVEGDSFSLRVLGETMVYRVDAIRVALPEEVDALGAPADSDSVTLVTETPFGVNSHRLLVRGTRE